MSDPHRIAPSARAWREALPSAMLISAMLVAGVLARPPSAESQPPRAGVADDERDRAFVEGLRREDPASAERFLALRDARGQALAELQRLQGQYSAVGPELRPIFIGQLRQAQRKYAESSLALLDFLDARDRRTVARYQEEIDRVNALLEERKRARAEFEKMIRGD